MVPGMMFARPRMRPPIVPPVRAPAIVLAEVWSDGERGDSREGRQAWRMVDRVAGANISLPKHLFTFFLCLAKRVLRPLGTRIIFSRRAI